MGNSVSLMYGASGFSLIWDQSWFSMRMMKTVLIWPLAGCAAAVLDRTSITTQREIARGILLLRSESSSSARPSIVRFMLSTGLGYVPVVICEPGYPIATSLALIATAFSGAIKT